MEVPFDLSKLFETNIVRMDYNDFRRLNPKKCPAVPLLIDAMGKLSSEAQKVRRVLTSYEKCIESDNPPIIYILWQLANKPNTSLIIGLLKVGRKDLYLYDTASKCVQTSALCILDFYVHFSRQRQGCGHVLYDAMLNSEGVKAEEVAIDKPSDSFLSFLLKHYSLRNPIWQQNFFVVYPAFFQILRGEDPSVVTTTASTPQQKQRHFSPRQAEDTPTILARNHVILSGHRGRPQTTSQESPFRPAQMHTETPKNQKESFAQVPQSVHVVETTPFTSSPRPSTAAGEMARMRKWREFGHSPMW